MGLAVKPKIMLKFLKANGFTLIRIEGSHHIMIKGNKTVPIPLHNKDLKIGTLNKILDLAGLTKKELSTWLGR